MLDPSGASKKHNLPEGNGLSNIFERDTKMVKKFIKLFIITFGVVIYINIANAADLHIMDIKFYGYFKGEKGVDYLIDNKNVNVPEGEIRRIAFSIFNDAEGVNTDNIDIEATLFNQKNTPLIDVNIVLKIFPKTSNMVYIKEYPEKIFDNKVMVKNAKWNKPVIYRKTISKINPNLPAKVVFEYIDLKKMINKYVSVNRWPLELKIEFTSQSHSINKNSKVLKIPLPAY